MAVLYMRSTSPVKNDQKLLVPFRLEWNKTYDGMLTILWPVISFEALPQDDFWVMHNHSRYTTCVIVVWVNNNRPLPL